MMSVMLSDSHDMLLEPARQARNILLVRLDRLGQVLMPTPAFAAIREASPQARLTLLASNAGAAALRHVPVLDDAIVYEAPWVTADAAARGSQAEQALLASLSAGGFDAAIIFTSCGQSALPAALLCRMAGIPLRLAHSSEDPHDLLTHWVPDADRCAPNMRHEVARQLDLVRAAGFHTCDERMLFRYPVGDVMTMRRKFAQAGADMLRPYIVVHPGAAALSRRYPPERFGQAAEAIARATGCQVIFSGSGPEQGLIGLARAAMTEASVSLAGQLSLGELGALMAGAQVALCNNSAAAQIAAAVGAPLVVLYALTHPQYTPWKVPARVLKHEVPCRDCQRNECPQAHHDCLRRIEPDAVTQAALELISAPPGVPLTRVTHRPLAPPMAYAC
jgi:lipopolysaccharide heptosyltransferase II